MKRFAAVLLAWALLACAAQEEAPQAPPADLTAEQDHQRLMGLLGIESIRPGRNGLDPNHPNFANYDEAKANPFPTLPDPLVTNDRRLVTSASMWERVRRPEIVELFDREIYGRMPARTPRVRWEVVETTNEDVGGVAAVTKKLIGHVDNSAYPQISVDIEMVVTAPVNAQHVPVMLNIFWITPPANFRLPPEAHPTAKEQVLARGWAWAIVDPRTVQADNGAGLTRGIIGLTNKGQPRDLDDWGVLRAWAWGASRAIDYLASERAYDVHRIALQGHSRYGKATLVAMAYDERIAAGFISSSGEGGASLYRRDYGEIVENLAGSGQYHWMAGNFIKYAGPLGWNDLPIDAHMLIALAAPRPVFISSGAFEGDAWVDARGMFMAGVAAGPVYRLLGKSDLGTSEFPPIETGLMEGEIAFRQHTGGHTPGPNWPTFLGYAGRYFEPSR